MDLPLLSSAVQCKCNILGQSARAYAKALLVVTQPTFPVSARRVGLLFGEGLIESSYLGTYQDQPVPAKLRQQPFSSGPC